MSNFWEDLERPITILAPMENVTDSVFRQLIASCGRPAVFFTEFTNVDWLFANKKLRKRAIHRLQFSEVERPLVAQIWGENPENYYKAAELIREMGFDGIDINMGCPAPKLRHKRSCSGLIGHYDIAKELIQATKEGAKELPVSAKTRLGIGHRMTEEWSHFLLESDLAALTMHGRIARDMSKVPADWDEIKKVVDIRVQLGISTPIIGNGDVTSLDEISQKVEQYGVDGVMVGRGIFRDPHLFNPNRELAQMDVQERVSLLLEHTQLFLGTWGDTKHFDIMKKFFKVYMADFDGALDIREDLMKQQGIDGVLASLQKHGLLP